MLNGIDPIILISLYKIIPGTNNDLNKIPLVSDAIAKIGYLVVPIYLSESLTGLFIDSEEKNIEINTSFETKTDGKAPDVTQKGASSTIKISLQASSDSIGLTLLSALLDQAFEKVTSKEYSITYLHGAVTLFGGLLHSYTITQNANDNRYNITIELSRGDDATKPKVNIPVVGKLTAGVPL